MASAAMLTPVRRSHRMPAADARRLPARNPACGAATRVRTRAIVSGLALLRTRPSLGEAADGAQVDQREGDVEAVLERRLVLDQLAEHGRRLLQLLVHPVDHQALRRAA